MTARSTLHHVVFAVAPQRRSAAVQMLADLGFTLNTAELAQLGIRVQLDGECGIEVISPMPGSDATGDAQWRPPMGMSGPTRLPLEFDR